MTTRRNLLKAAAIAPVAGAALATPAVAQAQITWRMQTYAGPALAEHVVKPAIDMFNKIAGERMQIELFYSDQLVPTGELFRAMQGGTIDAVQSDDDSMASPTEVTVFGGYFPFASRYSLDVPVLFNQYGLNEIWGAEYEKVGIKHISGGRVGPLPLRDQGPDQLARRPGGQARLHLPHRRPLPDPVRGGPRHPPLGGHRGRRADGRAGRRLLVRHYRGLHGRLGRRDQLLPHQQHLRRLDRLVLRQHGALERDSRGPPDPPARHLRPVALLPPVVVLGRRGQPAGPRHEDEADLDPGRGMGAGRGRCARLLGRNRGPIGNQGQGGRDLQAV